MQIAQFTLLVIIFAALWFALHHRSRTEARAFRRVAFFVMLATIVVAVLFPALLTETANTLGIGRGADLVLYLTAIGLLYVSISVYLKFGDMDRRITLLARQIALMEDSGKIAHPDRTSDAE